jgi:prolyl 4-hydroxylase
MISINIEGSSPHFIGSWNIEQNSLCDELVSFFAAHEEKQEPGQSAGGVNLEAKNSIDISVNPRDLDLPEYKPVKEYINCLYACYEEYLKEFPFLASTMPRTNIGSFNIQKYLPGGHFKLPHTERTSIQNSFRVLAFMTYLNDVEDGGSTTFVHQNMEVQPERGKTLIWPAEWTHAHLGNIVNSGEKYIITGWMHFPHESR